MPALMRALVIVVAPTVALLAMAGLFVYASTHRTPARARATGRSAASTGAGRKCGLAPGCSRRPRKRTTSLWGASCTACGYGCTECSVPGRPGG